MQIGSRVAWPVCLVLCLATSPVFAQSRGAQPPPAKAATGAPAPAAAPTDYVIGAEDVLGVVFWRDADMSGDVTVRPDGRITVPLLGDIAAAGMTPDALRDQIEKAASKFVKEPQVSIVIRQLNSRKVFITGQVATPGGYPLVAPRNVMQLISLAGGLTEYAKGDEITIMRDANGKTSSFRFNYKDVSKGKKLEQNIQLRPGDTVVVP
jgi:polysaccharide biosynthesis/export protein